MILSEVLPLAGSRFIKCFRLFDQQKKLYEEFSQVKHALITLRQK